MIKTSPAYHVTTIRASGPSPHAPGLGLTWARPPAASLPGHKGHGELSHQQSMFHVLYATNVRPSHGDHEDSTHLGFRRPKG